MTSAAPEARIRMFMDALVVMYQAEVAQLHLLQNGAVAALGLGTVTFLGGTLHRDGFLALIGAALALVALARWKLDRSKRFSSGTCSVSRSNSKG